MKVYTALSAHVFLSSIEQYRTIGLLVSSVAFLLHLNIDCVQGVDDLIKFWQNSVNIWLNYFLFPTLAFFVVKHPCEQNIWRTARARIMISVLQFGYMIKMT